MASSSNSYASPPPSMNTMPSSMQEFLNSPLAQNAASPGGDFQFADLLAEFAIPKDTHHGIGNGATNHISPDQNSSNSSGGDNLYDHQSRSPEELLLDHYGVSPIGAGIEGYEYSENSSREEAAPANQLAQAIASMDPSTQSQLLAALLAQSNGVENHQLSQQPIFQPVESTIRTSYPSGTRSHPQSRSNSAHPSPRAHQLYNSSSSIPPNLSLPHQYQKYANSNRHGENSVPGSNVSSPLAAPYPVQQSGFFPAPSNSPVPISLVQLQQQQALLQQGFANNRSNSYSGVSSSVIQESYAMEASGSGRNTPSAMGTSGSNTVTEMNNGVGAMRGGSATGGSYATTNDDQDWPENDFIFSPLMSPALTPHSAFSSHPPSVSSLPNSSQINSAIAPAEMFSPLGSPAILPHRFRSESASNNPSINQWSQVQGLVDKTQQLGFESSPQFGIIQQSPRMLPMTDGGLSTSTGSGRRGAGISNRKARPSPLLKPTPDGALVRRGGKKEKKTGTGSIGSGGGRSNTTSPFLGPTFGMSNLNSIENLEGGVESINTPSPVELMNLDGLPTQLMEGSLHYSDQTYLMGPPPLPNHSRRGSLLGNGSIIEGQDWLNNPVTPATFMNFDQSLPPPHHAHSLESYYPESNMIASGSNILSPVNYGAGEVPQLVRPKKAKVEETSTSTTVKGKQKAVKKIGKAAKAKATQSNAVYDGDGQASTSDNRKSSHKAAEQKRRDSLKTCFEELRRILPPLSQYVLQEEDRRPGEGNVGGQRGGSVDPENPNKGVSKVALLRRSNEYIGILHDRIATRDSAISTLRDLIYSFKMNSGQDVSLPEIFGFDLDNLDLHEKQAGTMASYECLESDQEDDNSTLKKKSKKKATDTDFEIDVNVEEPNGKVSRRSSRRNTLTSGGEGLEMDE